MKKSLIITSSELEKNHNSYLRKKDISFFKEKLLKLKEDMLSEERRDLEYLREHSLLESDVTDCATIESEINMTILASERSHKFLEEIDYALSKIESGEFGYCEMTGEEIGIKRLKLNPLARYTVDVQEQYENRERFRK